MMAKSAEVDCGGKHLRLAGLIVGVVAGLLGGLITWGRMAAAETGERLRHVEQNDAAAKVQYETIQRSLDEIKVDVKEMRKAVKR